MSSSQVGKGRGTTVAEVAGAAGGAYAGHEIEKRMKATKHYEVVVRLENGGSQTISYATQPAFAVGARVKVDGGTLTVVQAWGLGQAKTKAVAQALKLDQEAIFQVPRADADRVKILDDREDIIQNPLLITG